MNGEIEYGVECGVRGCGEDMSVKDEALASTLTIESSGLFSHFW